MRLPHVTSGAENRVAAKQTTASDSSDDPLLKLPERNPKAEPNLILLRYQSDGGFRVYGHAALIDDDYQIRAYLAKLWPPPAPSDP